MREIPKELAVRFALRDWKDVRPDLSFVVAEAKAVPELLARLRDRHGYTHLAFVTVVDRIEDGVFTLNYVLHNHGERHTLGVKCDIPRDEPVMESCHALWAQMWTYQRELREMYGIRFPGSPRVDEDFALEGWNDIPPMRRDFDTRAYSERTFPTRPGRSTVDPATRMKEQLYPEAD